MWKSIQGTIQPGNMPSILSASEDEDYKYNDLIQENSILKQELADLYEHLMIVDDSSTDNQDPNTKISSVGRLIVYDKSKRDTEMLMKQETLRQKSVLLEKELSYQSTHMKEQSAKIKDLESKLKIAQAKILTADAETVSCIPLKQKIQELNTQISAQSSELVIASRKCFELEHKLSTEIKKRDKIELEVEVALETNKVLTTKLKTTEVKLHELQPEMNRVNNNYDALKKQLDDQQIEMMKQDLDFMTSQSEVKHLERKVEAQSKELQKLYDAVNNLRTTIVQKELELAKEKEKLCSRCTVVSGDEEATSPLIGSKASRKYSDSSLTTTSSTSNRNHSTKNKNFQRPYRQVSNRDINSSPEDNSSNRNKKKKDEDNDELMFGDDCLCTFFPNLV